MNEKPHCHVESLATEEDTAARLKDLEMDYALLRVARSVGGNIASRGGFPHVLLNPELFGLAAPDADDEHPDLSLPRILRNGVYLPLEDRTLTALEFTGPFRKTPKKEREFLIGCTQPPQLKRCTVIERGPDFEYRAIAETEDRAMQMAAPGETVRALVVDCRDENLAEQIVESKRDDLPWCEGLKVRPEGTLAVGWHGLPLSNLEQQRLRDQSTRDHAQKRERLDKTIRQMRRAAV